MRPCAAPGLRGHTAWLGGVAAPRAVRRVSARTGAHERRKVGREAAGASVSQPEKSRKGAILGGLLGRVERCAQVRFFFAKRLWRVVTNLSFLCARTY